MLMLLSLGCQGMCSLFHVPLPVLMTRDVRTGSIESRAMQMDQYLQKKLEGRELNFIGHSMVRESYWLNQAPF